MHSLNRLLLVFSAILWCSMGRALALEDRPDGLHVFPGDTIQEAIEKAASRSSNRIVKVHAGEYRPSARRPAMIWFNRKHDGVRLEAIGQVILTAENAELARKSSSSYPAVVNHVVYFGHGISSNTVLRGFRITGANAFVTEKFQEQMEPDTLVPKNSFFVTDGGAIKIFGQSAPTLENLEIVDNYTTPCGGGVSVQQQGRNKEPVIFRNCVFRGNRAQVTGCALDLLEGSSAVIENCLFLSNIGNTGEDIVGKRAGEKPFENSGALTVFQNSRAIVRNCTFTGNRNGVDDLGGASTYEKTIFYRNLLAGGKPALDRYELDLQKGGAVRNCIFGGTLLDPQGVVSSVLNNLAGPDPQFDEFTQPRSEAYKSVGYRVLRE